MHIQQIPLDTAPLGRPLLGADRDEDQHAVLKRGWTVTLQSQQTRLTVQLMDSFEDGCYLGQIIDVEGWQDPDEEDAILIGAYLRFSEEHIFAILRTTGRGGRREA